MEALKEADAALYRGKVAGRNRIAIAQAAHGVPMVKGQMLTEGWQEQELEAV